MAESRTVESKLYIRHHIPDWIKTNQQYFVPPVCNKMMHGDGQLKVFYVGGPNVRKDFHLEEGEEFFYMVKGDMNLIALEKGKFKDVIIKEGEVFLLPGKIPHSPQRFEATVGLVVERERLKTETDCLRYFVDGTTETLFEKWFYCEDLGTQLGPIIKEFFASEQYKTGKPIAGTITETPPWIPNAQRELEGPFPLKKWIEENSDEIEKNGRKKLFRGNYESDITVFGQGEDAFEEETELFFWQIRGSSKLIIDGKEVEIGEENSVLVRSHVSVKFTRPKHNATLLVKMNPANKVRVQ